MSAEPADLPVRATSRLAQAEEWAVVLAAAGIRYRLEALGGTWTLVVPSGDVGRARSALAAYEQENQDAARPVGPASGYGATWIGAAVALVLIAFFVVTRSGDAAVPWLSRGAAAASRILAGEIWRTVTALTLHVDAVHLLGNALACLVLVTAVGQELGPGLGIWLVLLAGAGGNALTAVAHGSPHLSVGASTGTFGAVGILAARSFAARRRRPTRGRGAWVAVTASLALLAILGTGPRADLLAHLFGLLAGGALGLVATPAFGRIPSPSVQVGLVLAAVALVVGCWGVALATAPQ